MNTYITTRPMTIEQASFDAGETVGTGDIDKGDFTPSAKAKGWVELGHMIPRVMDGRIQIKQPETNAKATTKSEAKANSKKSERNN